MTKRTCFLAVVLTMFPLALRAAEPIFIPLKIDGPVHDPSNHTYWFGPFSECASVLDVNGDGHLDIAAGRNWYQGPKWTKHADFRDGAKVNGPETDNNSEFALDVNRDGRTDVVSSGWMFTKGAMWYENPGRTGAGWKATRIHSAQNMEGVISGDIDGDGDEDILVNHWALHPGQGVTWLESIDKAPWLKQHVVGTKGDRHGNGLGDVNGDGRVDIVTPVGWYEAPPKPATGQWTFHDDYVFHRIGEPDRYIPASHPILVHDCNDDGLSDLIIGASHEYGLAWLEQKVDGNGRRSFTQHWIEKDFGQFHTFELGDLTGDGKPELVTGKRLFAHHGSDISAFDPLFAFWYEIKGGKFERHVLAYNHLPQYPGVEGLNPPPNCVVAVGMKLNIADMDKDGRNDVVIAGKGGLYIFFNKGLPPSSNLKDALPKHDSYPSWIQWHK